MWTAPEKGRVDISSTYISNFYYQSEPNQNSIKSDGVKFRILINGNRQIYPEQSDWYIINDSDKYAIGLSPFAVESGTKILFLLDNNGECNYDLCKFDITIAFAADGYQHSATYNCITDFDRESDNSSAWSYWAVGNEKESEENNGVISEIVKVSYSNNGGGCFGSVQGSLFGGIVSILFALCGIATIKALFRGKRGK